MCVDKAGNKATSQTTFEVIPVQRNVISYLFLDTLAGTLHVLTESDATCEYALQPTGAGRGVPTTGNPGKDHEIQLGERAYYVTCENQEGTIEQVTVIP